MSKPELSPSTVRLNGWLFVVIIPAALILGTLFFAADHTIHDSRANTLAANLGLSDVKIDSSTTIFPWFRGCSWYSYDEKMWRMSAVNAKGQSVHFTICAGWGQPTTVASSTKLSN